MDQMPQGQDQNFQKVSDEGLRPVSPKRYLIAGALILLLFGGVVAAYYAATPQQQIKQASYGPSGSLSSTVDSSSSLPLTESEEDRVLQKLRVQPIVTLESTGTPAGWHSFTHKNWLIVLPPQFEPEEFPPATGSQEFVDSFSFSNKDESEVVTLTEREVDALPEKELISQLQEKYAIGLLDAVLLIQHLGFSSTSKIDQSEIAIERNVIVNGLPGVQFAVRNWDGETLLRTSLAWKRESELIDITGFPRSLDESDPSMQSYTQMLSSFRRTDD